MPKQTDRLYAESKELDAALLPAILHTAYDAIIGIDQNQAIILFNAGAKRIFGYTAAEVIGQPLDILLPPAVPEIHRTHVRRFAGSAVDTRMMGERQEILGRRKDGALFPAEASVTKVPNGEQSILVVILRDVTERQQAETALRDSEERFRVLFEQSPDAVMLIDPHSSPVTWAVLDCNEIAGRMNGYRREELIGQSIDILNTSDTTPEAHAEYLQRLRRAGTLKYETHHRRRDGAVFPIEVSTSIVILAGRECVLGIDRDITDRRHAEDQIRQQKERAEALAQISQALGETMESDRALNLITQRVADFVDGACYISLVSDDQQTLELVSVHHRDPQTADLIRQLLEPLQARVGEGMAGRVAQTGEPLLFAHLPPEQVRPLVQPEFRPAFDRLGLQSALLVPLKAERKILGVMSVTRDKPGQPFAAEDQTFLQNLADRVAQAIVNARLFTSAQRRAKHLEALNEIGNVVLSNLDLRLALPQILVHVQACLNVDAADVLLLGRHSHMLTYAAGRGFRTDALKQTYLRLGEGNAGRAALDRQVVNIPDLRADSGSFMRAPLFESEGFAAYYAAPLIAKGQVKGVLEVFLRGPFAADAEWLAFFHTLAAQTAIVIDSAALFADLQGSIADLHLAYDATIEGWSRALDLRDKETEGHTQRVTDVTIRLARAFGLSEGEILHIRRGALLHDIGKLGVPDAILHKPGQLTDDEWVQMREHPQFAYDMLAPITYLKPALDIPYCHHEKWDGTGYPRGLKGEQIPLAARLFAVVDVWDALRSDRPYRQGWPEDRVREHIHEQVGKHFDPRIAEMFLKLIESSSIMGLAGKE